MNESVLADVIRPGARRGLDFVNLDELRKRTGITIEEVLRFAMSEMLCNALDTDATEIWVNIEVSHDFRWLTIRDNGSKRISENDLKLILDFDNKASSKRGFLRVSRGYLGNALKCIFGYSYALAEDRSLQQPNIIVSSHGYEYKIKLHPDKVEDRVKSEIQTTKIEDDGENTFRVAFPLPLISSPVPISELKQIITATSMVNPRRRINFKLWDKEGMMGESLGSEELRKDTSVLWYMPRDFEALFNDYIRATPSTQLKEFISLFRGFTRKSSIRDILHDLNEASNRDSKSGAAQFVPATPISELSDTDKWNLCRAMKRRSKTIKKRSIPKVLGIVGEKQFEKLRQENGWERLRYTNIIKIEDQNTRIYPYIIELAIFDRKRGDTDGLQVYQCVNFMASTENIFSKTFDIPYRCGLVGIRPESPVTVLIHFVSPILEWLSYAKSSLSFYHQQNLMTKLFDKVLPIPKTPRVYHPPPPPKPLSWVPSGTLGDTAYEVRLTDFAREIKAVDAKRTTKRKFSSRGWCYALEGQWINKGEFSKTEKAINDCRKIGLLPIDFTAEDQDETRRFAGIHEASDPTVLLEKLKDDANEMLEKLPTYTTDYWENEKFYLMICTEKGDIRNLFKPICDEYHIPIISTKGWYPILLRYHIAKLSIKAEERGLTPVLLLFYDHDPAGLKITDKFRKGLRDISRAVNWRPTTMIIERFGLNKEDIDKYGLTWIDNLQTGSGREARDPEYIQKYGRRKCESNALFKNDETLDAAEKICRNAIEKYYGIDALERFREKEENSKEKLSEIYDNPVWEDINESIDNLIDSMAEKEETKTQNEEILESKKEVEVEIFKETGKGGYWCGRCPNCYQQFDYDESFINKLVRCRSCNTVMRLRKATGGTPH